MLINPPWSKLGSSLEHLGLGYMASVLRQNNIPVKILDFTIDKCSTNEAVKKIINNNPKLIGVSIPFQEAANEAFEFIKEIKRIVPKENMG